VRRALLIGLLALASCADQETKCVLLVEVTYVTVTDTGGAPIDALEFHTVRTDTGKDITPELDPIYVTQRYGQYPIVDDDTAKLVGDEDVPIVFTVSGDRGSASVSGSAHASEDGCGGTVYRGPDKITLGGS
jgi:hypothetical protein